MINKKSKFCLLLFLFFFNSFCLAETQNRGLHPSYLGVILGYGSTTWDGLVAEKKNQNLALMLSTPKKVEEGGVIWGLLTGYEFTPYFALEINYTRYADAKVYFDSTSLFSFNYNQLSSLVTQNESLGLKAKIMVYIPQTPMRLFSGAGVDAVHRKDIIVNGWRASPSFALGINYDVTEHLMAELVGNYTAGYGESELSPADGYFPFLYSVAVHLAYRI